MKGLILAVSLVFSLGAFASDVTYPVKNFKYFSELDFTNEVSESDKYVVMVFSSKECLERTARDPICFLFERKLDVFVPKFSPLVKVVAFNTYFDNYQLIQQFQISKNPTVIIIKNNRVLNRFEPKFRQPDINNGRFAWQDELLREVTSTIFRIH